jgi:hypothetical protein
MTHRDYAQLADAAALGEIVLLDGRNRLAALWRRTTDLAEIFAEGHAVVLDQFVCPDPLAYVVSANLRRRHLTAEQKRELIADLLGADPQRSDRATAAIVNASPQTVTAERRRLEATAQIEQSNKRVGRDGRTRPSAKPSLRPASPAQPVTQPARPPARRRDEAVIAFAGLLAARPAEVLEDLIHLIRDCPAIRSLPEIKRKQIADRLLDALAVASSGPVMATTPQLAPTPPPQPQQHRAMPGDCLFPEEAASDDRR